MTSQVACPTCGSQNAPDQRFCGTCGSPLTRACPSCGAQNPPQFAFCGTCGASLSRAPAAPAGHREERRRATVLFADVSGFTSLAERMDPEEVRTLANDLAGQMSEEVVRFGGTVLTVMGDAVMAVFGAPVAHEDDAERAVRAALSMRDSVKTPGELAAPLRLHIGINTGEVMTGVVGPDQRRDYTVMGDVTNTAARLQSAAGPGEVLVGRETHALTSHAIEYEELPPVAAKGKEDLVPAWRAVAARAAASERPTSNAPLVGRDAEIELVTTIWRQVTEEARPHVVTILGPAGIGKSRLLHELRPSFEVAGRLIRGRSLPYGDTTGYGALSQHVAKAAGILDSDPAPAAAQKLRARVVELLGPEAAEVASHLAVLMGLEAAGSPDKQPLFASVRRFVEALARERPTVLAFEDAHWAEPVLLELVQTLASRIRDVPLLILVLSRPELHETAPSWGGGLGRYTAVRLEPLGEDLARELALSLLRRSDSAETAVDELVRTGGGNPLFLEELAASLAENAARTAAGLPTSVQAIIAARLDALPDAERETLQDASVIGRSFWRGTLLAFERDPDALEASLEGLEDRDLIRRLPVSRFAGDPEYQFKHVLTREVAYETLSRADRRARHRVVAEHLERASGDRLRESSSLLAHHWREAGEPAKAATYMLTAAEAASRAWAKREAVELYGEAIGLLEGRDDELRQEAMLARARTRIDAGDYATAIEEDLDALLQEATGSRLALALLNRTRAAFWLARVADAHRFGEAAAELASELGDVELESRAQAVLAESAGMDGDLPRAVELMIRVADQWPVDRRDGDYAYALGQLGLYHYWRGEGEEALRSAREGFEIGVETSNLFAAVNSASHAGMALVLLSRHEEAFEWLQRAVLLGREWEVLPRLTGRATNMWAGTLLELGDLAEARRLSEEALEMGRAASFPGATVSARIDLLFADIAAGDIGRAEKALPELLEAAGSTGGWHQWLWTGRLSEAGAETDLSAGRPEDALRAAGESLERALRAGRRKYEARARNTAGRALLALGRLEEAQAELGRAVAAGEALGSVPTTWPAMVALARSLELQGKEEEASALLTGLRERVEGFAGTLHETRRRSFLAQPELADLLSPR
ncbi:MAG: AAA family ATPase [Actinobacteria bacterium]|nr:AAA family ATPase [Actinomycetota bacterium]